MATFAQIYLPAIWAYRTANAPRNAQAELQIFGAAVLYGLLINNIVLPRLKIARFRAEDQRRPALLAFAISQLTVWATGDGMQVERLSEIDRGMLDAIKSEVARALADFQGSYIHATLLTPDVDPELLRCINRTDTSRGLHKTYRKANMHAWDSMSNGRIKYIDNFHDPDKHYHSILCFPLYYELAGERRGLGAVTVDHQDRYAFSTVIDDLVVRLQPYLRVLELSLVLRETQAASRANTRRRQ